MKLNSILLVFYILTSFNATYTHGQQKGKVRYLHLIKPKHGFSITEMNAVLYFDKNKASYTYNYPKEGNITPAKDSIDPNGKHINIPARSTPEDPIGWIIFSDFESGEMQCRDRFANQFYIYEDTIPHIQWRISGEKRQVGDIQCQKAEGEFRGRTYEVWFAPSIPLAFGPWKISGLPGLILEVHSIDGEVSFIFESLEIPPSEEKIAQLPTDGKFIGNFQSYGRIG